MKKVAILVPYLGGGGAERVASNLLMHLPSEKYKKYLIVYDEKIMEYPYEGKLLSLDLESKKSIFGKMKNAFLRLKKIQKIKEEEEFDVVISFLESPNMINILTRVNDKAIISIRNYMSRSMSGFYGNINKFISKKLYNKSDLITVVSNEIKEDMIKNFGAEKSKVKVIYNPYDLEKIEYLSKEEIGKYEHIFENPTIINVGRLNEQKGQSYLIDIFNEVSKKNKKVNLVILGRGELEDKLKQKVKRYNLENRVFFLGFQQNPYKFIKRASAFVLTSLYEGFPNVLVEAMSCSTPVISTDCKSGPKEILINSKEYKQSNDVIRCDYGILLPDICSNINNLDEIIQKSALEICNLLEDEALMTKYGNLAYERARDFRIESIVQEWIEIIEDQISNNDNPKN